MSRASKITVTLAAVLTTGIISYVHYQQNEERRRLHDGVLRDVERQHNYRNQNVSAVQSYMEMTEFGEMIKQQEEEEEEALQNSYGNKTKPPLTPHEQRKIPKSKR